MPTDRPIGVPEARDGLLWVPPNLWGSVPHSSTSWTLGRTAAGDYKLSRTSAGAETHYLFAALPGVCRRTDATGIKPLAVILAYNVGVADATTITPAVNRAVYVDRVAVAVAAFGGVLVYDANHDTNAKRISSTSGNNPHVLLATLGAEQYQDSDSGLVTIELTVVIPNTSVFTLLGGGFRVAHNTY